MITTHIYAFLIGLVIAILTTFVGVSWYYNTKIDMAETKVELAEAKRSEAESQLRLMVANGQLDLTKKLTEARDELNKDYETRTKSLDARIADLKRIDVRLRDPGSNGSNSSSGNTIGTSSGNGSYSGGEGLLSFEASQFLLDYAGESQRYVERLRVCKQWEQEVKTALEEYSKKISSQTNQATDPAKRR